MCRTSSACKGECAIAYSRLVGHSQALVTVSHKAELTGIVIPPSGSCGQSKLSEWGLVLTTKEYLSASDGFQACYEP